MGVVEKVKEESGWGGDGTICADGHEIITPSGPAFTHTHTKYCMYYARVYKIMRAKSRGWSHERGIADVPRSV